MALTPESVASKTFTQTKFREGYDQTEVDDFLDEVVTELTRLSGEGDDLREQLATAGQSAGEGSSPGPDEKAGTAEPAVVDDAPAPTDVAPAPSSDDVSGSTAASGAGSSPAVPAQAAPVEDQVAVGSVPPSAGSAAGVLALAQRLHDEHVRAGEDERDRLVGDARTEAERLVTHAQETERSTLASLEERRTDELGALERERGLLERKIDELRGFEREYRSRLRAYLEGQLADLDGTAAVVPGGDATSATGGRS